MLSAGDAKSKEGVHDESESAGKFAEMTSKCCKNAEYDAIAVL